MSLTLYLQFKVFWQCLGLATNANNAVYSLVIGDGLINVEPLQCKQA